MIWKEYIDHISVSQIKSHERNPRRWALQKLVKLPSAGSPYTAIGKEIHAGLEGWLRNETSLEELTGFTKIFAEEWLEINDVDLQGCIVEKEIHFNIRDDLPPLLGYIDVLTEYQGNPIIIDHKTSRARRYFLKEGALASDTQLLVYAAWALANMAGDGSGIWVQHNQFAYSMVKQKLRIVRAWIPADIIRTAMITLADTIEQGIMQTITDYRKAGPECLSKSRCGECRMAFGPGSCEYSPICDGYTQIEDYRKIYDELKESKEGEVFVSDLVQKMEHSPMFSPLDLTELKKDDTITIQGDDMPKIMDLATPVKKARDKFSSITNTWDRREAMTKAVVAHVMKDQPDLVLLPAHFIGGAIDPDYAPIVTQLKEQNVLTAVRL